MKKFLKFFFIFLIVALVVIQFINRPDKTATTDITANDITKKLSIPSDVQAILKRSCYDCHSNQTVWPWYTNVAPVSWLVADDVVSGRKKMNLNDWGKLTQSKQEKKLADICDEITSDDMPLPKYLIIHKDAKLSQSDKDVLCNWTKSYLKDSDSTDIKK